MPATAACTDTDVIPKVAGAGTCRGHEGARIQVMHNGLLVEEGGHYGAWMTEVVRTLRGHHEPQEPTTPKLLIRTIAAADDASAHPHLRRLSG
jgi:hypothetical protein